MHTITTPDGALIGKAEQIIKDRTRYSRESVPGNPGVYGEWRVHGTNVPRSFSLPCLDPGSFEEGASGSSDEPHFTSEKFLSEEEGAVRNEYWADSTGRPIRARRTLFPPEYDGVSNTETGVMEFTYSGYGEPNAIAAPCATAAPDQTDNPGLMRDCINLLAVKDSLRGAATLNWSLDTPISDWNGVNVTGTPGRVTGLDLSVLGLDGSIPPGLWKLDSLSLPEPTLTPTEPAATPELDREALVVLYNATNGDNWENNGNWLSDSPIGEWRGVTANDGGRVIELQLNANKLSGEIPAELGSLSNLELLDLGWNQLSGEIPTELGRLASLRWIDLGGNVLSGEIPAELGHLASLGWMDLRWNVLSGEIPGELGNLSNLQWLFVQGNQLSGCVPVNLRDQLDLNESDLGELPFCSGGDTDTSAAIEADRKSLVTLYDSTNGDNWGNNYNWLSDSPIGEWWGVTTDDGGRVIELQLDVNELRGEIPAALGDLSNLQWLYLQGNRLSGCIPDSLQHQLDLYESDLGGLPFCGDGDTGTSPAVQVDREALVALYNATNGDNWEDNRNWLSKRPIGEWWGVTTDDGGRVIELVLDFNLLSGMIPAELGSLANLERLELHWNRLTGEIPAELGSLTNLETLVLSFNDLSGEIPKELGSLGNLQRLALNRNRLTGEIPSELGSLSNLEALVLSYNELSGEIPANLGRLGKLQRLDLSWNRLTEGIRPELGGLYNLKELELYGNQLIWRIPAKVRRFANLELLILAGNQLSNEVPPELGVLTNLRGLFLQGNDLRGCLPDSLKDQLTYSVLGNLSYCGDIYSAAAIQADREALVALFIATNGGDWTVNDNWLTDRPVGEWWGVYTEYGRVIELSLRANKLNGEIPAELGSIDTMSWLNLAGNQLSGEIPAELGSLASIETLLLPLNQLSGEIPAELGALTYLQGLFLAGNQLSGEVPAELGELSNLTYLDLQNNKLSGCVPGSLLGQLYMYSSDLGGLRFCDVVDASVAIEADREVLVALYNATNGANWRNSDNWLSDRPTGEWWGITTDDSGRVIELTLNRNQLSGELPTELGRLTNLERLELYWNQLSGEIPAELGDLDNLELLRLNGNQLSGEIPAELSRLSKLWMLDFSDNWWTGELPQGLVGLTSLGSFEFYNNTGLCAPVNEAFRAWQQGVLRFQGSSCAPVDSLEDRSALVDLYNATNGANWQRNDNWLSEQPIRDWYGVTTDESGRVKGLYLIDNELTGEIPEELGGLVNLKWLVLQGNQLNGCVPGSLRDQLDLSRSDLAGLPFC